MKARSLLVAVTAATSLLVSSGPAALAGPVDSTERALERAGVAAAAPTAVSIHANVVSAGAIRITLPSTDRTAVVVNGRARLDDAAVRHVVQATPDDGIQVLAVLENASAPTRLVYDFGDNVLTRLSNGWVVVSATAAGEPLAAIAPAWAKDANGRAVPTDYEVSGSALVQTVQTTAHTRYPVVADPTLVRKWYGAQIRFSKSETRYIGYGATACAVVAAGIPDPTISKIVAISCGLLSLSAQIALDNGKCLAANVWWTGNVYPWYWSC